MRGWPVVVLIVCTPRLASAQLGFLDGVFDKVSDIAAAPVLGRSIRGGEHITDAGDGLALTGLTVEVSIPLGEFLGPDIDEELCYTREDEKTGMEVTSTPDGHETDTVTIYTTPEEATPRFTLDKEGEQEFEGDSLARRLLDSTPDPRAKSKGKDDSPWDRWKRACAETPSLGVALALGYTQVAGFRGSDLNLRGSIEELPALTLYTAFVTGGWLDLYGGLRSGLAQVKGLRVVSDDTVFHAEGSTFQFGVVGPALVFGDPEGNWGLFLEPAWTLRKFDTIKWEEGTPPGAVLRGLDFSSFTLALGVEVGIGGDE